MKQKKPPLIYETAENRQMARILSILIWVTLGTYLFVIFTGLVYYDWMVVAVTLAGVALLIVPFSLVRGGHLRASSFSYTLIVLGTVTFIAAVGQGIRDLAIVTLPIIFIFAGLTLGRALFRLCIGLTLVAISFLTIGEVNGWIVTKPFTGEGATWFYLIGTTIILLVAALAMDLLATNMRKNLYQARSEIALRQQAEEALLESRNRYQLLFESAVDGILLMTMDGKILQINESFAQMHGYSQAHMMKMGISKLDVMSENAISGRAEIMSRLSNGEIVRFEVEHYHKSGETFPLQVTSRVVHSDGQPCILAFHQVITERKRAETQNRLIAEVQEFLLHPCKPEDIYALVSEKVKQLIGDGITAISVLDEKHKTVRMAVHHGMNVPLLEKILSIIGMDLVQKEISLDIMTEENLRIYWSSKLENIEGGLSSLLTHLVPKPACRIVEKLLRVQKIYAMGFVQKGERMGGLYILTRNDITPHIPTIEQIVNLATIALERKLAEEALRESEERLASIFSTTGDVMFLLDVEQDGEFRFKTVNPAFLSTTGLPAESVVGRKVKEVIPEPSLTLALGKYRQAIQEKAIVRWEETSDYPTGRLTALVTIAPILDAGGTCQQLVGNVHDITERKSMEEQLRYQGTHDAMTKMYNRSYFEEELARFERSREFPISIIVADVDGLKILNDTLGHAVGDELLQQAANVLTSVFRAGDVLARTGGDEFAALLPVTDSAAAEQIVARIRESLVEHNTRFPDLPVKFSLGTATAEKDNLAGTFNLADQRMYADKSARKASMNYAFTS